jgi:hypothetical protein
MACWVLLLCSVVHVQQRCDGSQLLQQQLLHCWVQQQLMLLCWQRSHLRVLSSNSLQQQLSSVQLHLIQTLIQQTCAVAAAAAAATRRASRQSCCCKQRPAALHLLQQRQQYRHQLAHRGMRKCRINQPDAQCCAYTTKSPTNSCQAVWPHKPLQLQLLILLQQGMHQWLQGGCQAVQQAYKKESSSDTSHHQLYTQRRAASVFMQQ